jgi:hypothetical protein
MTAPNASNSYISDLEAAIATALGDRNMTAVASLLRMLAVKSPDRAEAVLAGIDIAIAYHKAEADE